MCVANRYFAAADVDDLPGCVPKLENVRGMIEAFDGSRPTDLPLVIRTAHGLGEIIFVAADLDRPPFVKWPAQAQMLRKLLGRGKEKPAEAEMNSAQSASAFGYVDLSGQLRSALDQFQGIKIVPFAVVALLVCGYILLIGPGDYYFVKHVLKRMELTWITFPLIVLSVSAGAYFLAYWTKGNDIRLNQVDLVDVDVESGLVRGTTWLNLFSPRTEAYTLSVEPLLPDGETAEDAQVLFSWLGLPGSALGGMDPAANPPLFGRAYEFSPELDRMFDVPIQVWSTKSLTARWMAESDLDLDASFALGGDNLLTGSNLEGSLKNTLDVPLKNCLLAHDRWAYRIGDLKPGQTVELNEDVERVELQTELMGRRLVSDEKDQYTRYSTPYDQMSFDVPAILRQMMFFRSAGGQDYAQLSNAYQQFVDLSGHIDNGRAVLVGFTQTAGSDGQGGATLLRDGEPIDAAESKRWTCCRFVYDVEQIASER